MHYYTHDFFESLKTNIQQSAIELGFDAVGIAQLIPTSPQYQKQFQYYQKWLKNHYHGTMHYMENHEDVRKNPERLLENPTINPITQKKYILPETKAHTSLTVISVRMNYQPLSDDPIECLSHTEKGYIARYALGRDYHKVMRKTLKKLGEKIQNRLPDTRYRVCVDTAPVLERALAQQAGLGWIGKNTLLIHKNIGSYFVLGEIITDLPLPPDLPATFHCGSCQRCMEVCPTNAIVSPFEIDARKCIAYLTIEYKGSIPIEFREKIGNRIFGCDDCQIFCPWNRFATPTTHTDFQPRHSLNDVDLLTLFRWNLETFLIKTEGSPIRRTGFSGWLRNISIALGNAPYHPEIPSALYEQTTQLPHYFPHQPEIIDMLTEHFQWAITQQETTAKQSAQNHAFVNIDLLNQNGHSQ